jgi:hypothetical protein
MLRIAPNALRGWLLGSSPETVKLEVQAHLLEDLEPNAEVVEREEERTPRVSAHLFTPMQCQHSEEFGMCVPPSPAPQPPWGEVAPQARHHSRSYGMWVFREHPVGNRIS